MMTEKEKMDESFSSLKWTHYGYEYCSFLVSKYVLPRLNIPPNGYIVQVGCGLGLAIENLCSIYGPERVIGYDWLNPLGHPNIQIVDCNNLNKKIDLAFCEIDVAAAATHPELRLQCLEWAINNVVKGGKILFNNNFSSKYYHVDIEKYMMKRGFEVEQLKKYECPELMKDIMKSRINTKMICTKM
tara:strand:+ start:260 stop:817 length:558 start_codon:yes stop_codon:yes gene_type:complete